MIIRGMSTHDIPSGALRLADWGLIRAEGADAASFLHAQLTQDITGLREGQARLAGWCTAKGRLLASLVVWRSGPELFHLALSADLLAPTLKKLSMFVLRAKCKLSDAGPALALHGLAGAQAAVWLGEAAGAAPWTCQPAQGGSAVRLPDVQGLPRWLLALPAEAPAPALPALPAEAWAWLEVMSGLPRIQAATTEQFVPQMVNLELVGGVNFKKGCYPGQEVVARSQYRGTLKRRGQLVESTAPLAPAQELFHSADPGQPAGMVVLAAPRPGGGSVALVELKLAALDGGSLHAGAADGPAVSVLPLPYPIPLEQAA